MDEPPLLAKLGAEFLGTFGLVFGGCGSAVLAAKFLSTPDNVQLGIGFLGVSLAFGLTVLTGAYAFGHVSGGHFHQIVAASLAGLVLFIIASGQEGSTRWRTGSPATVTAAGRRVATGWARRC